jgi:hypothetical protein
MGKGEWMKVSYWVMIKPGDVWIKYSSHKTKELAEKAARKIKGLPRKIESFVENR